MLHEESSVIHNIRLLVSGFLFPVGCSIVLCTTVVIPICMIAMGSIYLHDCPQSQFIPIYLIVEGEWFTAVTILNILKFVKNYWLLFLQISTELEIIYKMSACFEQLKFTMCLFISTHDRLPGPISIYFLELCNRMNYWTEFDIGLDCDLHWCRSYFNKTNYLKGLIAVKTLTVMYN
jgi:hypothetical protein